MYRLGPCITILGGGCLIKNTKKMSICEYIIFRIDTCEKCFFRFEKGYKRSLSQIAPIHTAHASTHTHTHTNTYTHTNINSNQIS